MCAERVESMDCLRRVLRAGVLRLPLRLDNTKRFWPGPQKADLGEKKGGMPVGGVGSRHISSDFELLLRSGRVEAVVCVFCAIVTWIIHEC